MKLKMVAVLTALLLIGINASLVIATPVTTVDDFGEDAYEFDLAGAIISEDFTVTEGSLGHFWNTCTIDFTSDISAVGLNFYRGKTSSVEMAIYDADNILLECHIFTGLSYSAFIGLYWGTNSIAWASFKVNDDIFADTLFYKSVGESAPVPEPSTMLLLGAGLVGARRKLKK